MAHFASPFLTPRLQLHALAKNWWLLFLRGIAAIVFGVLAIAWPALSLVTLVILYGAFTLADGVLAIAAAIAGVLPASRWWLALIGVLSIAVGVAALAWPAGMALVLLAVIAVWAIVIGATQIIGAIRLRKEIHNEWLLIGSGVLSVAFGLIVLARPTAGALAMAVTIGVYFILYGVMMVRFSLRLREHGRD